MSSYRLGPYRLVRKLGTGGSASVVEAIDERDGASVALKIPHPDRQASTTDREAILHEAWRARLVRHPNVVAVLDVVDELGTLALVLELSRGVDASRLATARAPLPPAIVAAIASRVARGLDAIHSATDGGLSLGMVHGDVSPANVLIGEDGSVKLTDFGLARRRAVSAISASGVVRGSAGYVAPEVVRGRPPSIASDLFSLGVVMYELSTGREAFRARDSLASLRATVEQALPAIDSPLGPLVAACAEKRPERRPASAREVAVAIERTCPTAAEPALSALVRALSDDRMPGG